MSCLKNSARRYQTNTYQSLDGLSGETVNMGAAHSSAEKKGDYVDSEILREMSVPQDTLFAILQPHIIPMETVRSRGYGPALDIVQLLIGVQPTCDMVLEIWPPAFHSYNVIVPNCLNLPALLLDLGTQPKTLVPLAMYVSSLAANCAYCSAHCCSFSARRGATLDLLKQISLDGDITLLSSKERAVFDVAHALGSIPCTLSLKNIQDLEAALSKADCEWIVAAATMFGSFNKLMDGLGIPLEPSTYAEVNEAMGKDWSPGKAGAMIPSDTGASPPPPVDNLYLKLQTIYIGLFGGLASLDAKLLSGIPTDAAAAGKFLYNKVGHSFPVLQKLSHGRFICALTQVITLNFNDENSAGLTMAHKILAGILFADHICSITLKKELVVIAKHFGVMESLLNSVCDADYIAEDPLTFIMLKVTRAISSAPANVTGELLLEIRTSYSHLLTPPMIVELVSFIAVCQMLHRVESYYLLQA